MTKIDTLCHMAWDYVMFFPFDPAIGYCCRSPRVIINNDMVDEYKEELFSNLPQFVERREALLNNVKHKDCATCWQLEDNGFKSSRHDRDMFYYMKKNTSVEFKTVPEMVNFPQITRSNYADCIEIVLNNVCDAKCTYCNEVFSTQWYLEKKKFNDPNIERVPADNRSPQVEEYFWNWYQNIGMKELWRFGFIGGEPFIVDALYEYLDKLIEIHEKHPTNKKKELCITSNMNTPSLYFRKFQEYLPKLQKHFTVIIQASGESVGKELEYVRSGVFHERWKSNIEYFLENTTVTLNFLPTLNLLSLPTFINYVRYWESLCLTHGPIAIFENIVTSPRAQSPILAPKEFMVYLDEPIKVVEGMLEWKNVPENILNTWRFFLNFLKTTQEAISKNKSTSQSYQESARFYDFFSKLDERRNSSVTQTFPEFTDFYELGKVVSKNTQLT